MHVSVHRYWTVNCCVCVYVCVCVFPCLSQVLDSQPLIAPLAGPTLAMKAVHGCMYMCVHPCTLQVLDSQPLIAPLAGPTLAIQQLDNALLGNRLLLDDLPLCLAELVLIPYYT